MLSYQYGPKYLRNVSNTLLNLCHDELGQFWRQSRVQPDTSKVYLIVTNDRSEARVDPLAALIVQGQTGKYQAEVSGAT